jgi:hypothetical protein
LAHWSRIRFGDTLSRRSESPTAFCRHSTSPQLHRPIAEWKAAKLQRCNRLTHFRTLSSCVRRETPNAVVSVRNLRRMHRPTAIRIILKPTKIATKVTTRFGDGNGQRSGAVRDQCLWDVADFSAANCRIVSKCFGGTARTGSGPSSIGALKSVVKRVYSGCPRAAKMTTHRVRTNDEKESAVNSSCFRKFANS